MNPEDVKLYTFRIVPTVRRNPFEQKSFYRFEEYVEPGCPTIPDAELDCTEAQAVIARIKAGL